MSTPSIGADGRITYNFAEIHDMTRAIGTYQGAMNGILADLFQDFQGMFDSHDWDGAGGTACNDAHLQCDIGAKKIEEALGRVAKALDLSSTTIQQIDDDIAKRMNLNF